MRPLLAGRLIRRLLGTAIAIAVATWACSDSQEPQSVWDDLSGTIYFLRSVTQDTIAKVDPRTGTISPVTGAPRASYLAVSPDGKWLLITARHVLRYSLATGEVTVLAPFVAEFNAHFGAVSPDGRRVVHRHTDNNGQTLMVRAADGSEEHALLPPQRPSLLSPQWVDEETIVYISAEGNGGRLRTIRADGSGRGFFASDTGLMIDAVATAPQIERLLVVRRPTGTLPDEFWELDYSGALQQVAVLEPGLYPRFSWSPDGQYAAFCQLTETSSADLFIVHVASGEIKQLTFEPEYECSPAWAP